MRLQNESGTANGTSRSVAASSPARCWREESREAGDRRRAAERHPVRSAGAGDEFALLRVAARGAGGEAAAEVAQRAEPAGKGPLVGADAQPRDARVGGEADLAIGVGDRHDLRPGGADRREHAGHPVPGDADGDIGAEAAPGLDLLELVALRDEVGAAGEAAGEIPRGHQDGIVAEGCPSRLVVLVAEGDAIERDGAVPDEGDLHRTGQSRAASPALLVELGGLPLGLHLVERRLGHVLAVPGETGLDRREASPELEVGGSERPFGIDLEMAGQVRDGEQQVADLLGPPRGAARPTSPASAAAAASPGSEQLLELGDLLVELGDDFARLPPVEADSGRLLGEPVGGHQRRQRGGGGAVEQRPAFALLRPHLAALPGFAHRLGGGQGLAAEDVRMAGDHLGFHRVEGGAERGAAGLLDEAGDEDDLEEQVAELAGELGAVAAVERRGDLMGLLEQVGPQIG